MYLRVKTFEDFLVNLLYEFSNQLVISCRVEVHTVYKPIILCTTMPNITFKISCLCLIWRSLKKHWNFPVDKWHSKNVIDLFVQLLFEFFLMYYLPWTFIFFGNKFTVENHDKHLKTTLSLQCLILNIPERIT